MDAACYLSRVLVSCHAPAAAPIREEARGDELKAGEKGV